MLSRIADSLFWLNRYMERTDGMLRTMRTHYIQLLDKKENGNTSWRTLLQLYSTADAETITRIEFDAGEALQYLILDTANLNSLKVLLTRARENARGAQDHITKEVWEQVNHMYHSINNEALKSQLEADEALLTIDNFARETVQYTGITDITMQRGLGWIFMNLGKYVERSLETLIHTDNQFKQLHYNVQDTQDIIFWRYLLLCLSGYEMHLKNYQGKDFNYNVLHQVLFNENFPRSLVYSLCRIEKYLDDAVNETISEDHAALHRQFGRLYSRVKYMDVNELDNNNLHPFLESVKNDVISFSRQLSQSFFSYT